MRDLILANRYLQAFVNSLKQDKVQSALQEVIYFGESILNWPGGVKILSGPLLSENEKKACLTTIHKTLSVDVIVFNFYQLLLRKRRLKSIPGIVSQAKELLNEMSGTVLMSVSIPEGLNSFNESKLKKTVALYLNKEVTCDVKKDPDITCGFKSTVGFLVFDGTLENSLSKLSGEQN